MGDHARAHQLAERALVRLEKHHGPKHGWVATALYNAAEARENVGRIADALPLRRRALEIWQTVEGKSDNLPLGFHGLATHHQRAGRHTEALAFGEKALAAAETTFGRDHPQLIELLSTLAELLGKGGDEAKAIEALERSVRIADGSKLALRVRAELRMKLALALRKAPAHRTRAAELEKELSALLASSGDPKLRNTINEALAAAGD